MGVMSLGISHQGEVVIEAAGADEAEVVAEIVDLIESGFGEE